VNAITQIKDRSRYLRSLSAYVGYANQAFPYQPIARRVPPREKSFVECVNLAISITVANSQQPLRLASLLALALALLNLGYSAYVLTVILIVPDVAAGWTTLSLTLAVMGVGLFLVLAVVSAYLSRVLDETRQRPLYYVAEERASNVLTLDVERKNVVSQSESPAAHGR
jgi:dolichol-phosphate mannosyltransferase